MKDSSKKFFRSLIYLIISVYVLSIPYEGKTLYAHARKVLVDNDVVTLLGEHCADMYEQAREKVRIALLNNTNQKEKSKN